MNYFIFGMLAAVAGACIAIQASANGNFRHNINSSLFAAFFSICGTFATAVVTMLLIRPALPPAQALQATPWWNWIGGPLGALIVLAGALLVRELGAAMFISLVVAGQLICSLVLDHFGLLGLPEQPLTFGRILGALLILAGALCMKYL